MLRGFISFGSNNLGWIRLSNRSFATNLRAFASPITNRGFPGLGVLFGTADASTRSSLTALIRRLKLTKADLVDKVTSLGDLTRRDGEIIVDLLFDAVIGALKANDKVEIRGFGSFRTRQRNSRTGRNPKTGESVAVPAKRVPFFKPSKELRDLVNPKKHKAKQEPVGVA